MKGSGPNPGDMGRGLKGAGEGDSRASGDSRDFATVESEYLDSSPASQMRFASFFSQSVGRLFTFLMISFPAQEFLIRVKSGLSDLSSAACGFHAKI